MRICTFLHILESLLCARQQIFIANGENMKVV